MDAKSFAAEMQAQIQEIREAGTAALYCDNIIEYLERVKNSPETEPSERDLERYKAELQSWVDTNKQIHETQLELFRSVITYGQSALKSAFILYGGAAVALLAFIANLVVKGESKVGEFAFVLYAFSGCVLLVSIATSVAYLAQWFYASDKSWSERVGLFLNLVAIILVVGSYFGFFYGLHRAYGIFLSY